MPVTRRDFLSASAVIGASMAMPAGLANAGSEALYTGSLVIDGLGFPGGFGSGPGAGISTQQLEHIRVSGLSATHFTVGDVGAMQPLLAFEKIIRDIAHWEHMIDVHPEVFQRVRGTNDLMQAKKQGTTGLIYGLQDGVSFEDDLGRIGALRQVGVRVIQPTYNRRNLLGDGCMEPANAGLSRTGREAIERINGAGITLDLSHCGRQTTADALSLSTRPTSFTHTGCDALVEHPRHRTDAEIRAAADSGGVVGIYIMPYLAKGKQPTADDVIAHLDHAINVAGEDHVCFGTDGRISPTELTPEYKESFRKNIEQRLERGIAAPHETPTGYLFADDLNTPRRFETLSELMLSRGYSESRVEKVLGRNLERVFEDTW